MGEWLYLQKFFPLLTRYFIFFSFKGTLYHGWQLQPKAVTVQKIIDEAITLILDEKIAATGAGRTDAGVHARFFCAHFDSMKPDLDTKKNLIFKLNRYLPDDISVSDIRKVVPEANARFSAVSRTYKYYVSRVKDPFNQDTCWFIHGDLNIDAMNRASGIIFNHSDFTSFSRLHSDNKTNICKIYYSGWEMSENMLIFSIKADRFLRNMVRAIVGTMIEAGRGRIEPEEFERILESKNRSSAGMSAPAKGLFLTGIEYPEEIFA